jgi:signal transduction histidine kinase
MEVKVRDVDGVSRWFLTRVAPVSDGKGGVARWFGTSTDVQALREARDAALAASRAKSEFLTAMSHELRTPLNAIGGYAELMEMGIRGPVTKEQRRDLSRIKTSQEHLLGLIASLLDLTRIENGSVHYAIANVAVAPVFSDVEALIGPQAAAKQQVVTFDPPGPQLIVRADREKLRQILLNLLSNAVRHTPAETSIQVNARRVDARVVEIVVRDDGPGVSVEVQHSIFEPFVQLDRTLTNSGQQGLGLGLAISRDLARGMGGELTIESAAGAGAAFTPRTSCGCTGREHAVHAHDWRRRSAAGYLKSRLDRLVVSSSSCMVDRLCRPFEIHFGYCSGNKSRISPTTLSGSPRTNSSRNASAQRSTRFSPRPPRCCER